MPAQRLDLLQTCPPPHLHPTLAKAQGSHSWRCLGGLPRMCPPLHLCARGFSPVPRLSHHQQLHQPPDLFHLPWSCFTHSSVGKESACNAGDPGLIPGSGRSSGEGLGYPFQYSWASLVTRLLKNPSIMQETWVRTLGWDDPLEKGKATHSSILPWRILWTVQSMGSQRVRHD